MITPYHVRLPDPSKWMKQAIEVIREVAFTRVVDAGGIVDSKSRGNLYAIPCGRAGS
jgi:hypothetical protein